MLDYIASADYLKDGLLVACFWMRTGIVRVDTLCVGVARVARPGGTLWIRCQEKAVSLPGLLGS